MLGRYDRRMLSSAWLLALGVYFGQDAVEPPPNIVLVVVDDMGWSDLSCQGSTYYETPHIDRLAAEGVRFGQAYAACAVCSPSRAAILTGRTPARLGVTDWIHHSGPEAREAIVAGENIDGFDRPRGRRLLTPRNKVWLEESEWTLAEALGGAGYATCHVGKWHLGPVEGVERDPTAQGFDENFGGCEVGQPPVYFDPYRGKHRPAGLEGLEPREEGEYLTDREAAESVAFIERNADRPFFLYLAHYAVHSPIQAKPDLVKRFEAKQPTNHSFPDYAAMIASVDHAMGAVLATLEEHDILDRTVIVFTSDNGGATHFRATDNAPLRKGKGFAYEGGLRVPMLVRWADAVAPSVRGGVSDTPVSGIDLFPTLLAAARVAPPDGIAIDGVDLAPALRGEPLERDVLTWHFPHYWWGTNVQPYSVIRQGDWKLIFRYEDAACELYDLAADPGETRDLAAEEPERVEALRERLMLELSAHGARLPKPNPAYGAPKED